MDRNVGPADRVVRIVVALGVCVVIYVAGLTGIGAILAGIAALYFLITGLLGRCVVYKVIGVDTTVQEQPYSTTDDRSGL
jgi:hypothetical protein